MNIIDILFTSEWVSTLFIVVCAFIAGKIFVLPKDFERCQAMRILLMKRVEDTKGVQTDAYNS